MKKILGVIALVLVLIVAGILGFAATRPNVFQVERSTAIKAPPEKIIAILSDFHESQKWSPWEQLDPAMKRTISGPPSGKGAIYAWEGNDKVGQGRQEILDVTPTKVEIKLDFLKPFESHCIVDYTLETKGDTTTVTWNMHGPQPFIGKVMCLFMDMDKTVGKDFETGLANLKALAEK